MRSTERRLGGLSVDKLVNQASSSVKEKSTWLKQTNNTRFTSRAHRKIKPKIITEQDEDS